MNRELDMCVSIPVRVAAIVGLWACGVGLVLLQTLGYEPVLGRWGALSCLAGTSLTFVHVSNRHHRMLRQAFELGQETERARLAAVR